MPDHALSTPEFSRTTASKKRLAIVGGGPTGLFLYKRLVEANDASLTVHIFEAKAHLGGGMPYSSEGAGNEHVTNVSGNEIPELVTSVVEWLQTLPGEVLKNFDIDSRNFNEYKVLPRLLFGKYLEAQFELLLKRGNQNGLSTTLHTATRVTDITDQPELGKVAIHIDGQQPLLFDYVVICTGHVWPHDHEHKVPNFYDSPYPPSKLAGQFNHPVAIRGSSLTAVDAIRTLARQHGAFVPSQNGMLDFVPHQDAENFRLVMHSRHGLLPCVRFHIDNPYVGGDDALIPEEDLAANRAENDGFVALDFMVDKKFKQPLRDKDPAFYDKIRHMSLEQFVSAMLDSREQAHPFALFKKEYREAEQSIRQHKSIYWKEMLAALSFAMNYPAKHMAAEDMIRHQQILMPLISVVIAFIPQSSCRELIALHDAGRLDIVSVGADSKVEPKAEGGCTYHYENESSQPVAVDYAAFVDSVGQRHLSLEAFPFQSLVQSRTITPATLKFKSNVAAVSLLAQGRKDIIRDGDDYFLQVPGMAITDDFQVIDSAQQANPRIYMLAVPYIAGHNPDYSGLDFCEEASKLVVDSITGRANVAAPESATSASEKNWRKG